MFKINFLNFLKNHKLNIVIIGLSLIYFFVTFFESRIDVLNPDSINWHNRSYLFMKALSKGELSQTYQAYHPGITLMWVMGISSYNDFNYFTKDNFLNKDFQVKISIYFILTLCFAYSIFLLKDFLKLPALILFSVIYTFEPFILGVRRLVHLEALMTAFLLLSFLLILRNSFIKSKISNLVLAALFFVLAFYTKSSAILIVPVLFLIYLLGPGNFKQKILQIGITLFSLILFLYLFFPALWKNPIVKSELFFTKIYEGATLVGYEGRREVGTSGTGENLILKKSHSKVNNFYLDSIIYSTSPSLIFLLVSSLVLVLIILIQKVKTSSVKILIKNSFKSSNFYITLFSFIAFTTFFVVYSLSTKSYERYSYVFYPFIILFISSIYNLINFNFIFGVSILYFILILIDLINIRPYYYSYGNSLLGGSFVRYEKLNSPPFGVAIYELSTKLSEHIKTNDPEMFPVIAGSKSLKAIFSDGKNERYPLCDVDYFIQFYDDKSPKDVCIGRSYNELFSIKVGNIDYWKVYKFERRSSKSKKLIDIDRNKQNEVLPEVENNE